METAPAASPAAIWSNDVLAKYAGRLAAAAEAGEASDGGPSIAASVALPSSSAISPRAARARPRTAYAHRGPGRQWQAAAGSGSSGSQRVF